MWVRSVTRYAPCSEYCSRLRTGNYARQQSRSRQKVTNRVKLIFQPRVYYEKLKINNSGDKQEVTFILGGNAVPKPLRFVHIYSQGLHFVYITIIYPRKKLSGILAISRCDEGRVSQTVAGLSQSPDWFLHQLPFG